MNIKNLVAKLNEPLVDDNNRRRDEVGDRRTVSVSFRPINQDTNERQIRC